MNMKWLEIYYHIYGSVVAVLALTGLFMLFWTRRLPSVDSIKDLFEVVNTRGGNIVVLLGATGVGCAAAVRFFYYVVQLSVDGKVSQDNVFALMALTFITGTITGNFQGALLKTMTGETTSNGKTPPAPAAPVAPATPAAPPEQTPPAA